MIAFSIISLTKLIIIIIIHIKIREFIFQSLLEKRAENHQNWLEEWWLNTAYLEYRDPVVIFSSPGLVLPFCKFNNQQEQLKYAAKTILAALDYKLLIDK